MAGRLKRRSSVGGSRRESMVPLLPDSEDETAAEEEERRARNRQRKQQQLTQLDSPGNERSETSRRSIGGIAGLTASQLADHYSNCIKLSAENKISTKNAFSLQLIDYMATMIKQKESNMSNFQVAAGTLDASTKIYAYRVDAVYGDTLKIASGLGHTAKQADELREENNQDEDETAQDGGDPNSADKKARKRNKRSATVEKNLKNLNVAKFELEFDVDPLFKKTSSQFDGATCGNQFLSTLEIRDETSELLLDSESSLETRIHDRSPTKGSVGGGVCQVPSTLPPTLDNHLHVCATFAQFSFNWNLDSEEDDEYNRLNESISASQEERSRQLKEKESEHAFDALAVPEPMEDYPDDEDTGPDGGYDMEEDEVSERALGHRGIAAPGFTASLPMTTADMLSALTTAPLEYSYFDHGKLGAWAGPKHWKFKPLGRVAPEAEKGARAKKKKEICPIDYEEYDEIDEELQAQIELLLSKPKKPVRLVEKTIRGWSRDKNTLPEDLHYSGHDLVRLKVVDRMIVAGRRAETLVDDVEDYDYNNQADREAFCPDIDDNNDAYDAAEDPVDVLHDSLPSEGGIPSQISLASQDDYFGDNLVEAPKLVDKAALQIGYAKTAKKVDMKRIKTVTWAILTQASREEKENSSLGASPERVLDNSRDPDKTRDSARVGQVEETKFSQVYRTLKMPNRLPPKMSENLSVSLAFLALLHLCNEENLQIIPDPKLDDFTVVQG